MTKGDLIKIDMPDSPGVYMFRDGEKNVLYIGKAASLKDRVRSYFANDIAESRSSAIAGMVAQAATVTWKTVDTVLEALILEANLIKKHEPPYNVDQKDNKSFNYLVITEEIFPRIIVVRGRELFLTFGLRKSKFGFTKSKYVFGPFPHGGALYEAVKLVRKVFPFRDSCSPCEAPAYASSGRIPGAPISRNREMGAPGIVRSSPMAKSNPCFNRQIGLCPGICTGEMGASEYRKTIKNIVELFSGGLRSLKRRLEKEMRGASKKEDFECAERLRRQISALSHIRDVSLIKNEYRVSAGGSFRIEAYDIAHSSGSETVGVMTVVENGEPYKSAYRMFKVREAKNDDTKALSEVLGRRLAHPEWQYPKLIVVDGGKGQLNTAKRVLQKAGVFTPLVAVTKDEFHRASKIIGDERMTKAYEKEILLANSEAHRFAIAFHRRRSRKAML